jgi:hypothetical protein
MSPDLISFEGLRPFEHPRGFVNGCLVPNSDMEANKQSHMA